MKNALLIALLSSLSLTANIPELADLSLDEKIGQLLIVATTSDPDQNKTLMEKCPYQLDPKHTKKMIKEYHVGGVIFLGAGTPEKQVGITNRLQKCSKRPISVALDAENGLGMRHKKDDVITYPWPMTLGALSDSDIDLVYKAGLEIGRQCRAIGITYITSPVADVNTNPDNPIINTRSFGQDPKRVAQKASVFMQGLAKAGVLTGAKHFPGHGDVDQDSHCTLPTTPHTKERLEQVELVPFKKLIRDGVDTIITSHLSVPQLAEEEHMPATFSHNIVTKLLRKYLKFKGLIVTDGMGMKGVTENLKPGEPELKALQAGHDLILCPVDIPQTVARIKQALEDGTLSEDQINKSVERILHAKRKANIQHPITYDKKLIQSPYAKELKQQLYQAAITLARNENNCLPLQQTDELIPVVACSQEILPPFAQKLQELLNVRYYDLPPNSSKETCNRIEKALRDYSKIIISLHIPGRSGMIELHHTEQQNSVSAPLLSLINKLGKKVILVLFGNPYNLKHIPDTQATIVAYEDEPEAQVAAAQTIVAEHYPRGQLPVTAGDAYPAGLGLHY